MHKPIICAVAIRGDEAKSAREAFDLAKTTPAYRKILREHPVAEWHRKHRGTALSSQSGFWMVEFELVRKDAPA